MDERETFLILKIGSCWFWAHLCAPILRSLNRHNKIRLSIVLSATVNFRTTVKQESSRKIQKKGEFQGHTLSVQESNPASAPSRPL